MPKRSILDTEVVCPMSGARGRNGVFQTHKLTLMHAVNGALYARCTKHRANIFIQDRETVESVLSVSTVVREIEVAPKRRD